MRLFGIAAINLSTVQAECRDQQREMFRAPCEEKDNFRFLVIFQRSAASSSFSTSARFMKNMCESRLRKHVRERTKCSICHVVAANRMIFGHESEAMKTFVA